jgi:hypothetical protein
MQQFTELFNHVLLIFFNNACIFGVLLKNYY